MPEVKLGLEAILTIDGAEITNDYEVLGLASDGRHYFWISFLELHDMSFR
jgi:hypothetical protein